jgi:hypothetical protein
MSTMFERGRAMINRRAKQAAGVSVVYARDGNTISITATPGRTRFQSSLDDGVRMEWGELDFSVVMADLVFGGVMSEPRLGDRITRTVDGPPTNGAYWDDGTPMDWDDRSPVLWEEPVYTRTYEVVSPGDGQPGWRDADNDPTAYRMHVKRVY